MDIQRFTDPRLAELGFDSMGSRMPQPVDTASQITQTQSAFPDVSINNEKIENLAANKLISDVILITEPLRAETATYPDYGNAYFFAPMSVMTFDYNGGTTGGPQDADGHPYDREGCMYVRVNYGAMLEDNFMVYVGGAWRTVTTS